MQLLLVAYYYLPIQTTLETIPFLTLLQDIHQNINVIALKFIYNPKIINELKISTKFRWSSNKKYWYLPEDEFHFDGFYSLFSKIAHLDFSRLDLLENSSTLNKKTIKKPLTIIPKSYTDLLDQKRYSDSTRATYISYFRDFINTFDINTIGIAMS